MVFLRKIVFIFLILSSFCLKPQTVYLYSHGLASTYKQVFSYAEAGVIYKPFISFNYPDALEGFRRMNNRETSMAQDNEILRLKMAYEKTLDCVKKLNTKECDIILFGLSRGASAAINLMGMHHLPHIKALVLEAPFDSVGTIVDFMMQRFGLSWMPHTWGESIMECIFSRYRRNGIRSIDMINLINKDLPILIICSRQDQLVPWYSSVKLFQKLRESGHTSVHIYIADHGRHSKILWNKDGQTYQKVVHAFYQLYGLPHDPALAKKGKKYLKSTFLHSF